MKKFVFPLERVLQWRHTQARLEEVRLDQLRAQGQALDQQRVALEASVREEGIRLHAALAVTGQELAALEHYRAFTTQQAARLAQARAVLEQKVQQQVQQVAERRRDAKLLERLRGQRRAEWAAVEAKEIEEMAAESFLARLSRENRMANRVE